MGYRFKKLQQRKSDGGSLILHVHYFIFQLRTLRKGIYVKRIHYVFGYNIDD